MIIKNRTVFPGEEVRKTILEENSMEFWKRMIIVGFFLVVGSLVIIINTFSSKESFYLVLGIGLIIYSSLSFALDIYKLKKSNKNIDKDFGYEIEHGIIYDFDFHEEKFKLKISVGDRNSKVECFYNNLKKIVNKDDCIIFTLSGRSSYKCKKNGFKDSKQEELFFYGLSKHKIKISDKRKQIEEK